MSKTKFDLSHEFKTTTELGVLTPFYWSDVVPGDSFKVDSRALIRLQPLLAPVYNRLTLYMRYYFVPYRLLIPNWKDLLKSPDKPYRVPMLWDHFQDWLRESDDNFVSTESFNLLRLFGIHSSSGRLDQSALESCSSLPFRAYQLVHNYFFKSPILDDTYLDEFRPYDFMDPARKLKLLEPQFATYFGDYFTEGFPSTQYGTEVAVDLNSNGSITVGEVRMSERLQTFREKLLRAGKSFRSFMGIVFGVDFNDAIERPILIGSSDQILNISDVDQVVPSETEPLGNVGGKSVSVSMKNGYSSGFNEHGIVLGLSYVLPSASYIAGIPREFQKKTVFDFYLPDFAAVGMQPVQNNELDANRTGTFSYRDRYAELKFPKDVLAGDFSRSLSYWHFGRDLRQEQFSKDFLVYKPNNSPFAVKSYKYSNITPIYASLFFEKNRDGNFFDWLVFHVKPLENLLPDVYDRYTQEISNFIPVHGLWSVQEDRSIRFLAYSDMNQIYLALRSFSYTEESSGFEFKERLGNPLMSATRVVGLSEWPYVNPAWLADRVRNTSLDEFDGYFRTYEESFRMISRAFMFYDPTSDTYAYSKYAERIGVSLSSFVPYSADGLAVYGFMHCDQMNLDRFRDGNLLEFASGTTTFPISGDGIFDQQFVRSNLFDSPHTMAVYPYDVSDVIFNHVLMAVYNDVSALRPIPRINFSLGV